MSSIGLPDVNTVVKDAKTYAIDLTERVLTSALGGFIAGLTITQPLNASMWYTALGAGVAAGVSVVKGILARGFGSKKSASLAKSI